MPLKFEISKSSSAKCKICKLVITDPLRVCSEGKVSRYTHLNCELQRKSIEEVKAILTQLNTTKEYSIEVKEFVVNILNKEVQTTTPTVSIPESRTLEEEENTTSTTTPSIPELHTLEEEENTTSTTTPSILESHTLEEEKNTTSTTTQAQLKRTADEALLLSPPHNTKKLHTDAPSHSNFMATSPMKLRPDDKSLYEMVLEQQVRQQKMEQELNAVKAKVTSWNAHQAEKSRTTLAEYYTLFKKITRPIFWTESTLGDSIFTEMPVLPGGSGEKLIVQPWWTTLIEKVNELSNLTLTLVDSHASPSIGSRKPDFVLYDLDKPRNQFNIHGVGEAKGRRSETDETFKDDDKGQLLEYMQHLLKFQAQRTGIVGFLTDGHLIQFFYLSVDAYGEQFFTEWNVEFMRGRGGALLLGLLRTNIKNLGANHKALTHNSTVMEVNKFLGQGSSSSVYSIEWHDKEPAIAKVFLPTSSFRAENERKILAALRNTQLDTGLIPSFLGKSYDGNTLFLRPVGTPFASREVDYLDELKVTCNGSHFEQLVMVLKEIHKTYVHRDITLDNFFEYKGKLLLNDWGSAVQIRTPAHFEGALTLASTRVLYKLESTEELFEFHPEDDLEMLVHCVFMRMSTGSVTRLFSLEGMQKEKAKKIREFWDQNMTGIWGDMVNCAKNARYVKLGELIRRVVPG